MDRLAAMRTAYLRLLALLAATTSVGRSDRRVWTRICAECFNRGLVWGTRQDSQFRHGNRVEMRPRTSEKRLCTCGRETHFPEIQFCRHKFKSDMSLPITRRLRCNHLTLRFLPTVHVNQDQFLAHRDFKVHHHHSAVSANGESSCLDFKPSIVLCASLYD